MAKTIQIGCKLPNGLTLEHPLDPKQTVTLKSRYTQLGSGENVSFVDGGHSETTVDADFWAAWKLTNAEFPAFKAGAIFEAKDSLSLASIAKEREKVITGFEGAQPAKNGVKDS